MENDAFKKSYDTSFNSVTELVEQSYQAWREIRSISLDEKYEKVDNIIFCGMGGSSLPAHIILSMFNVKVPVQIYEDYRIPKYAGKNSLVVLSSYSGNTEEVLSCSEQAKENECLIFGITSGGKLGDFLTNSHFPLYIFDPKHNSSKLPRYGLGYGIFAFLGLLVRLNFIKEFGENDLDFQLKEAIRYLGSKLSLINDSAEEAVNKCHGDVLVVFSSQNLKGNGRTFANQINETSKTLAFCAELPEANHNLIEGFRKSSLDISVVFLISPSYPPRIAERFSITKEIIDKNGYKNYEYKVSKGNLLQEMLETLLFSSLFSVKLSQYKKVDPLKIDTIDNIKKMLSLTK